MSEELKSCPFCGSAPELLDGGSVTAIRCSSDQCISRPEPFNDWGHKESAIAAWNRRTQPEPAHTGDDMLKLSHLDRALKHEEMLDRSRDRAKYPQPEPAAPAEQDWSEPELWAEIYRLRAAVKGPDGFDSWQDAATDERIRRVRAERALAAPSVAPEPVAWRWKYKFRDIGETGAYEYHSHDFAVVAHLPKGEPLFTHPPRAPLTDADLDKIIAAQWGTHPSVIYKAHRAFARAVIAADRGISAEGEKT